ncbi:MAG: hypothetical protein ACHQ9S_28020 [Candidatus Binatia bacterium]
MRLVTDRPCGTFPGCNRFDDSRRQERKWDEEADVALKDWVGVAIA